MTFLPSFMCSLDATAEPPFRGFESLACAAVAWLTLAFSGDAHANPIAAATPAMILLRKLYLRRVDDRSDRTAPSDVRSTQKKCHEVTIASTGGREGAIKCSARHTGGRGQVQASLHLAVSAVRFSLLSAAPARGYLARGG